MVYIEGRLEEFDHHHVITLPNGKRLRVPRAAVTERNGELMLDANATIELQLEPVVPVKHPTVMVPQEVMDRLT